IHLPAATRADHRQVICRRDMKGGNTLMTLRGGDGDDGSASTGADADGPPSNSEHWRGRPPSLPLGNPYRPRKPLHPQPRGSGTCRDRQLLTTGKTETRSGRSGYPIPWNSLLPVPL